MMSMRRWGAAAMLILGAACATARQPGVAVSGAPGDLSRLRGEWAGEYTGAGGRAGSIIFNLTAGADSAHGDVMMSRQGSAVPLHRAGGEVITPDAATMRAPHLLAIRFVRIDGGRISGAMEPYLDPECDCPVSTRFVGELRGEVIEGTFTSRGSQRGDAAGTWRVTRRPDRPPPPAAAPPPSRAPRQP
jgi:hypothetical protein